MWRPILHRDAFANRRRYAQQAFVRTCSYTERFVQREALTHRRLDTQRLSPKEALPQKLLDTNALNKDAFAQRSICAQTPLHIDYFTQTLSHTEAFTRRNFCTKQLLCEEVVFPPNKKQANRYSSLDYFPFLSFPFRTINAKG